MSDPHPSIPPVSAGFLPLTLDGCLLFVSRSIRMFAYGFLSVGLVIYLSRLGLSESRIGLLLTLTLIGDTAISLWLTTRADRLGRRRMLLIGSALMTLAGVAFALTDDFLWLLIAATIGVISPGGNEVGPFLAIEQAALSQVVSDARRTRVFAWYALNGSLMSALGALAGGGLGRLLGGESAGDLTAGRLTMFAYALCGCLLLAVFTRLSSAVEAARQPHLPPSPSSIRPLFGLLHSRGTVLRLSALFALDAFAGGFVLQSLVAYWFHVRFAADPAVLGAIFFGANLLAGFSALAASRLADRFGLINTMVFTHLPSNILLILVPLMPSLPLAVAVLLLRFSISQMDVPTRQSYAMAVARPEERAAAAGVTNIARTIGAAIAPIFAGLLFAHPALFNVPFFIAGGLKILYDLLLYRGFIHLRPVGKN